MNKDKHPQEISHYSPRPHWGYQEITTLQMPDYTPYHRCTKGCTSQTGGYTHPYHPIWGYHLRTRGYHTPIGIPLSLLKGNPWASIKAHLAEDRRPTQGPPCKVRNMPDESPLGQNRV